MTELDVWARRAWAGLEVLHVTGYFSMQCREQYKAAGLRPALAYFAARSAAMGAVPPEVTEATFYVFAPRLIRQALPGIWDVVSPARVLEARHAGMTETLHRLLDDVVEQPELEEAVSLARKACEALTAPGRALYAGHASLPWPQDPLLQLWHAATLLREHRGDGHVAALTTAGLGPVDSMWTAVLSGTTTSLRFLRKSRGWTEAEWDESAARLRRRGWIEGGDVQGSGLSLTDAGAAARARIEASTDEAALPGWQHLGLEDTQRLATLVRPWRDAVLSSGILAPTLPGPA